MPRERETLPLWGIGFRPPTSALGSQSQHREADRLRAAWQIGSIFLGSNQRNAPCRRRAFCRAVRTVQFLQVALRQQRSADRPECPLMTQRGTFYRPLCTPNFNYARSRNVNQFGGEICCPYTTLYRAPNRQQSKLSVLANSRRVSKFDDRGEIGSLIAEVVRNWDARTVSDPSRIGPRQRPSIHPHTARSLEHSSVVRFKGR
jgi:hypothetical protein